MMSYLLLMNFYQWDPITTTQIEEVCELQRGYAKKWTSFGRIPWEYLGQPINFSAVPRKYTSILLADVSTRWGLTAVPDDIGVSI